MRWNTVAVGVLAVLVIGATFLCVSDAIDQPPGTICFREVDGSLTCVSPTGMGQPVLVTDWMAAITPRFSYGGHSYGSLSFGNGSLLPASTVTGVDNTVVCWIIALPKYARPGSNVYISTASIVLALVFRDGSIIWNSAVDNAVVPRGTVGNGGRFVLPSGFFQRLPRKK